MCTTVDDILVILKTGQTVIIVQSNGEKAFHGVVYEDKREFDWGIAGWFEVMPIMGHNVNGEATAETTGELRYMLVEKVDFEGGYTGEDVVIYLK